MGALVSLSRLLVLAAGFYQTTPKEEVLTPSREVMWRRLDLSHRALRALVLDDFEALEAFASDLVALSEAGESLVTDKEGYLDESRELRRAAAALGDGARARDPERAALAYVGLTLRCVKCHHSLGEIPRRGRGGARRAGTSVAPSCDKLPSLFHPSRCARTVQRLL
jgi:hypothetical protein